MNNRKHYSKNIALSFLVTLIVSLNSPHAFGDLAREYVERIGELPTIVSAHQRSDWQDYFKSWEIQPTAVRGAVFRAMLKNLVYIYDKTTRTSVILGLQSIRKDLPFEIRWLLAAVEIENSMENADTLTDAHEASLNTKLEGARTTYDAPRIDALEEKILFYKNPRHTFSDAISGIRLDSLNDFIFLHGRWQAGSGGTSRYFTYNDMRLMSNRVDWLKALTKVADQVSPKVIKRLFDLMNTPTFLGSGPDRRRLLVEIWNLVSELRTKYALSLKDEHNVMYEDYADGLKPTMNHILGLVKSWTLDNLSFLILNYRDLQEARILSLSDLFARTPLQQDRLVLEEIISTKIFKSFETGRVDMNLAGKTRANPDTYFVAFTLWTQQNYHANAEIEKNAYHQFFALLDSAKNYREGVTLKAPGLEETWMSAHDFNFLLKTFYKTHANRQMTPEFAEELFKFISFRTESTKDSEWDELEWLRLQAVENSMPAADFKAALTKKVMGNGKASLYERVLAAKYLSLQLKPADLDQIILSLKAHEEGIRVESFKTVSAKAWSKNEGELIAVMSALAPQDHDLRDYLSEVFVKKMVDGPVGPRDALTRIVQIGFAPEWLKVELIRRLKYIENGDSAGNFSALLSLFPNEGLTIAEVIYAHVRQVDILVFLLQVLTQHARYNPAIIGSIRSGLQAAGNSDVARAKYQKLSLDQWVEQKVAALNAAATHCREDMTALSHLQDGKI